jgi:hypothetical protein
MAFIVVLLFIIALSCTKVIPGVEEETHMRKLIVTHLIILVALASPLTAQMATRKGPPPAAASTGQTPANLIQLMRGILYPASNVIFAAQSDDFAKIKPAKDPATATDPLQSTYGTWQAVENASLALVESASLLTLPGRKCANGVNVPLRDPDWAKFTQDLREAGLKAYKAAQAKNQDNILDAAEAITNACAACHDKWREKPNLADRCK